MKREPCVFDIEGSLEFDAVSIREAAPQGESVLAFTERRVIESALEAAGGVQREAARLLFISPYSLNRRLAKLKLRPKDRKGDGR